MRDSIKTRRLKSTGKHGREGAVRGHRTRALATLAIGLFVCALAVSPAQAAETHVLSNTFGSFNEPLGVIVDNSTNPADPAAGDVYVADTGSHKILRFDSSGHPAPFTDANPADTYVSGNAITGNGTSPLIQPAWVAVDPANGDFYVSDPAGGVINKYEPAGHLIGAITNVSSGMKVGTVGSFNPGGIAVDPADGNLWLSNRGYADSSTYSVYSQIGELDSSGKVIEGAGFIAEHNRNCECSSVEGLAVNSAHDVYVTDEEPPTVIEYTPTGEVLRTLDTNGPTAVAIDPSSEDAYIAETSPERLIREFNSGGEPIDSFGLNSFGASYGLAVDASHNVYVADHSGSEVSVFSLAAPPNVTTNTADDVTSVAAKLNGSVDPAGNGEVTSCHFEYGATTAYSSGSVPCEQATPISSSTPVSAKISGLAPSTTFHFRLVASNAKAGSTNHANDQTFTTSPPANHRPFSSIGGPTPVGVAVDNSASGLPGELYVANYTSTTVSKYHPNGSADGQIKSSNMGACPSATAFNLPAYVAVNPSNGDLYVSDFGAGAVTAFAPSGECLFQINSTTVGLPISGSYSPFGPAVDPSAAAHGNSLSGPNGVLYVGDRGTHLIDEFDAGTGAYLGNFGSGEVNGNIDSLAADDLGNVYVNLEDTSILKFTVASNFKAAPEVINSSHPTAVGVDPSTNHVLVGEDNSSFGSNYQIAVYGANPSAGDAPLLTLGAGDFPQGFDFGIAVDNSGNIYASDYLENFVNKYGPKVVPLPEVGTGNPSNVTQTSAKLSGMVDPAGSGDITECFFEVSEEPSVPCEQNSQLPFSATTEVTATVSGLSHANTYSYHLVVTGEGGEQSAGQDVTFTALPNPPTYAGFSVSDVHADSALLGAEIDPGGGNTTYRFEYGTADCSANPCASFPVHDASAGSSFFFQGVSAHLFGLSAETEYHWRVVATNAAETTASPDHTFTTFPSGGIVNDPCPNAHVRQQTGASFLPDCRAYELVSAANTGGYAVESNLVAGETPFGGYPEASGASGTSRVLYAVHYGGVPGVGDPTNKGDDPYVATRGKEGWSTSYVGIPASTTPSKLPFASTLGEADPVLDAFAFAGEGICSPCFEDGSSGTPIHLPTGELIQGMAGSLNPGPSAKPTGYIGKHFSADGTHFVFGSTSQFEPDGNNNGDVSIYDRNLSTGQTHVVSKTPGEATMTGPGIAELDISSDGSRILIGQLVGTDAKGNSYYHLYMDIGDSNKTVDLTPGTIHGVLYDGMSADGSKVFFTTSDPLTTATNQDTDTSADIYQAEVSAAGALTLTRVSTGQGGSAGNTDSCTPASNWNAVSGGPNCNAVAIGGGGGVASGDGTIYFFSPELLDGSSKGTAGQPNLYVARPGSTPSYVTTLETDNPAVIDAVQAAGSRRTGDFQVNPSGNDAVFTTKLPLKSDYNNAGHTEIYRYDAVAGQLACASCNPTSADATGDASLAENGLSLSNDGRVFFDSTDALAPRDLDGKIDVYEWSNGKVGLISTGTSTFDAKLLSASTDGTDVFFFTRDTLVNQDENGTLPKLYDARELGGFPYIPPPVPCKASDECHGPSSQVPPPPNIGTFKGSGGNVRAPKKHHKHHKHQHKRRKAHRNG